MKLYGRELDTRCPLWDLCVGQGYCHEVCPPTPRDTLRRAAELEHELDMLPHYDVDIIAVCGEH